MITQHARRLMTFLRVNGYSNPTPADAGPVRKVLSIPHKLLRATCVLVGISLDRRYDRRHRVSTCGAINLDQLDINSPHVDCGELYDSIPERTFHQLIQHLPVEDPTPFTFIDYGSGKGRVLFLAARHPFQRIIGVEFSKQLHDSACENLKTFVDSQQRCESIESHHGDACDFELPDTPSILFFFTPFHGETLERVLTHIRQRQLDAPRPVFFIWLTDPETHPVPPEIHEHLGKKTKVIEPRLPFDLGRRYPLTATIYALHQEP